MLEIKPTNNRQKLQISPVVIGFYSIFESMIYLQLLGPFLNFKPESFYLLSNLRLQKTTRRSLAGFAVTVGADLITTSGRFRQRSGSKRQCLLSRNWPSLNGITAHFPAGEYNPHYCQYYGGVSP